MKENIEQEMVKRSLIKPYGDTLDDGRIQLSFALPAPANEKGKEAARLILRQMGLEEIEICHIRDLSDGFAHFIAYATCNTTVDLDSIKVRTVEVPTLGMEEIDEYVDEHIGRELVVVGACIESDAHTVGIDAIMNMKGFAGHYGLERYEMIEAFNMGSQVTNEEFLKKAVEMKVDVLLVSQTVTQKDVHVDNLVHLVELLEAEGLRDKVVLICGGPRISHELAKELGYDAGFGPGKYADDVATFAVQEMIERELI